MIQLSEIQRDIVENTEKHLLVTAGAGSGKTRVLTQRINHLSQNLRQGEKILAMTFSNKASNELKERLLASVEQDHLDQHIQVCTIHEFCLEAVLSKGHLIGLPENLHICDSYQDRLQLFKEVIMNVPAFQSKYLTQNPEANQKK